MVQPTRAVVLGEFSVMTAFVSVTEKRVYHRTTIFKRWTSCILSRGGLFARLWQTMKEWFEYAAVWVVLKGLGILPRPVARSLAAGVARILYALLPKLRRTAEMNLKIAFPEWSDGQRQAVIRGMVSLRACRGIRKRTLKRSWCWRGTKTS
jgi:hypothetical protein